MLEPRIPDLSKLGWTKVDNKLFPTLSEVQAAPEAVVELLKCNCSVSFCSKRCNCRKNNIPCTELCKCEASEDCCNTPISNDDSRDDTNLN